MYLVNSAIEDGSITTSWDPLYGYMEMHSICDHCCFYFVSKVQRVLVKLNFLIALLLETSYYVAISFF